MSVLLLQEYAVKYWRDNGIPLEKLIMEFTTYGRTFQLSTSDTSVCTPVFLEQGHLVLTHVRLASGLTMR